MIKRYVDFELQVSSAEEQIEIDINGRPYAINLPKPIRVPLKSELVDWKKLETYNAQEIAPLGHFLYGQVFVQDVESRFYAYLNRRKPDEGVRLCVNAQANDLSKAAWEILCSQLTPSTSFLALDPRTPIIRCTRIGREVYLREIRVPLKLLVVLASPRLIEKIDAIEIKSSIERALGNAIAQRQLKVDYLGFNDRNEANFDRLQDVLANEEAKYDIVHIIAHGLLEEGQEGVIALVQSRDGKEQDVYASDLANLFRSRGVMLVILQSCQSGAVNSSIMAFSGVAQQLVASGVPAVLAMQEPIDQDVATYFIDRLYSKWLGAGCLFEDALTQARQSVKQEYPTQVASWAIPVLYICPGVQLSVNKAINSIETKEGEANERLLEAALPQHNRVGRETELVVLVRAPTMPGLQSILGARPQVFDVKPEDVRTSYVFEASFPKDENTGKASPTTIRIEVETTDFELTRLEEIVQIRPQGDSVLCTFPIIPKKEGTARVIVRVLDNNKITLAQLLLKTTVQKGEAFETEYMVANGAQDLLLKSDHQLKHINYDSQLQYNKYAQRRYRRASLPVYSCMAILLSIAIVAVICLHLIGFGFWSILAILLLIAIISFLLWRYMMKSSMLKKWQS